ncbi:GNAT family N-acetyltransferase [Mesobacillus zeae]|uniref:N-acetyltransferase n=1 Tax=Mesobacillus zeae TaxID=1917180 RepID=A0A398BDP9_9BACI|nr:GNAT family N-acetyltransferase [Mesobacillus zeae]RID88305.1 N-acetyltransferase [Mesobacillus zeae]
MCRVKIRPIKEDDLPELWKVMHGEMDPEWKKWDAPYFPFVRLTWEEFIGKKDKWVDRADRYAIEMEGNVIGSVSYYWEHESSKWLEMGITIYHPQYWSGGYGTEALKQWIDHLFQTMPIVRVGYTTWSGNERMVKVGEKLGMMLEARIRKVRYHNGKYYDSIRMGMLREEWLEKKG